jgi:Putative Ig domain
MIRQQITAFILLLASFLLASCGGGEGSSGTMTAAPSGLKYPTPPASFVIDTAIAALTPSVTGEVTSYSVRPGLPAGLSFKTTTGVILGTPTVAAAEANYTVTATNAGGSTTAIVSIVPARLSGQAQTRHALSFTVDALILRQAPLPARRPSSHPEPWCWHSLIEPVSPVGSHLHACLRRHDAREANEFSS